MQNTEPGAADEAGDDIDAGNSDVEILSRQIGEYEAKLAAMRETVLRERAELDNQRKRLQRDLEQARKFANEKLLADLLPVMDNLERGLKVEGADVGTLRGGIELTMRELTRVAEGSGLKSAGVVGEAFDPERHQAMSMVDSAEHPSGRVVEVLQKGYVLNDRLLRPALVSVSN